MSTAERTVSVVIPCFKSGDNLGELVDQLVVELDRLADRYEVLLVNDGSGDDTWDRIRTLVDRHECVRGFNLMRNFGQHSALFTGIKQARMATVATMDDDLQHPPEELAKLVERLGQGFDLVYGLPRKEQHGFFRDLTSVLIKKVLEISLNVHLASDTSAFRVFRGDLVHAFDSFSGPFVDIDALLVWCTRNISALEVEHRPRKYGRSNYGLGKLALHAVKMITSYSILPLRLASFIGFFFTLFGLGVFAYVLQIYFVHGVAVQGFTFLASIIALFSGAQLFAMGILGEYLARVHFHSMGYPVTVVRDEYPSK